MVFETLETERLILRPPRPDDVDVAYEIHGDPATNVHNPDGPHPDQDHSERMLEEWLVRWRDTGFDYLVVEERASGEVLGFTGVRPYDLFGERVLNLYYRYRPSAWGRGIATEAGRAVIAWAESAVPDLSVVARTTPDNTGSIRTARKVGLVPAGQGVENGIDAVWFRAPRVQEVSAADVDDELRTAILDCWVEATNAGGAIGFVAPTTPEAVAPTVDAVLAEVESGERSLVVVRVGSELAGLAFLSWNDFELFRHWATVRALQVHPKWQGAGLGRVLLDGMAGIGGAYGLDMLRLDYREGLGLGAFYERCGFVEVGRVPGAIRVAPGDDRDQVYMMRRL